MIAESECLFSASLTASGRSTRSTRSFGGTESFYILLRSTLKKTPCHCVSSRSVLTDRRFRRLGIRLSRGIFTQPRKIGVLAGFSDLLDHVHRLVVADAAAPFLADLGAFFIRTGFARRHCYAMFESRRHSAPTAATELDFEWNFKLPGPLASAAEESQSPIGQHGARGDTVTRR